MGAALGIAHSLWWRTRWLLISLIVYLALLAVGVQYFPKIAEVFCVATIGFLFAWAGLLTALIGFLFAWAGLLTAFTFGPTDLGSKNSGFPTHMLVLPVRARSLVGWPMLYGMAFSALLWCGIAGLVLKPGGVAAPLIWPAIMVASATAWVQSLIWSSFPTPWIRSPLLIAVEVPIAVLAVWAGMNQESALVVNLATGLGCGWTMVAYAVGVRGLSKTRCGDQPDWLQWAKRKWIAWMPRRAVSGRICLPPYRSAAAAQFSYDFWRNAVALPLLAGFTSLMMLSVLVVPLLDKDQSHDLLIHSTVIKSELLGLGLFVFVPLCLASMAGMGMGKFDYWGKLAMPTFCATRPMTTTQYVWLKFQAAALAALTTWGIVLLLLLVWVGLDLSPLNQHESLVRAAWTDATPKQIVASALCAVALLLLMMRACLTGCWLALVGRKSFVNTASIGLPLASFLFMPAVAEAIHHDPAMRDILIELAPWIMAGFLMAKLGIAALIARRLLRLRLIAMRQAVITLLCWATLTACICGALWFYEVPLIPLVVCGVALLVPLARIAAAPLALYYNRHR